MDSKIQQITNLIGQITIPGTSATLESENRIVSVQNNDEKYLIKYKRDNIGPKEKRELENQIVSTLKELVTEENLTVMTVSENNSQDVYGVSENPNEPKVVKEQKATLNVGHGPAAQKRKVPNVKKILAVSSCKGGVGKSTVSVNLALSLKNLGHKVGLLDADIYGPSIPMLLGCRSEKPVGENKKIFPIEKFGLKVMSFGFFIEEKDPVIWRGPMLGGVLNQFLFDVEWGELDYLIIDLPPGTGDMQLSMVQMTEVDGVVIVSTPQDVALLDTKKGMNMFTQVKIPILGIIENMGSFVCDSCDKVHYLFGKDGVQKLVKELGVNYLGTIPFILELRQGGDDGQPYMANSSSEGTPVWKSYVEIAKKLTSEDTSEKKGFFSKIFKK